MSNKEVKESPEAKESSSEESASEAGEMDVLRNLLSRFNLHGRDSGDELGEPEGRSKPEQLLKELSLEGIAEYIKEGKCKNVIVMSGAGISTSAGIPDFRSAGTGLYDNLQKYNLPNPQAIFEIGYFKENPEPFFALSKELFPGQFYPTPSHHFIRLLNDKGVLLRHFTQNIDTLDRAAGVPDERIMEAHGSYHMGHCMECNEEYTEAWMRVKIMADLIPKCDKCDDGVVKPDVVFFGESLPIKFFPLVMQDFPKCDLLIIMGTSLVVQPFASLIERVPATTPRLLFNMEKTGQSDPLMMLMGMGGGMDFDSDEKYRDVAYIGPCDEGCTKLADLVGWKDDFDRLCEKTRQAKKEEDEKKKEETKETKGKETEGAGEEASSSSSASSDKEKPSSKDTVAKDTKKAEQLSSSDAGSKKEGNGNL